MKTMGFRRFRHSGSQLALGRRIADLCCRGLYCRSERFCHTNPMLSLYSIPLRPCANYCGLYPALFYYVAPKTLIRSSCWIQAPAPYNCIQPHMLVQAPSYHSHPPPTPSTLLRLLLLLLLSCYCYDDEDSLPAIAAILLLPVRQPRDLRPLSNPKANTCQAWFQADPQIPSC